MGECRPANEGVPTVSICMATGRRVEQIAMSEMPRPGDLITAFSPRPGRCYIVASEQIQATHCYEPTPWRGRWTDAKGKVHRVWACEKHAEGLVDARRRVESP